MIGLPPLGGAVQDTVAEPLPAVATTPAGAPGTVGGAELAGLNSTVDISQMVCPPVLTVAFGVAPAPTTWSSASSSICAFGEMFDRWVKPAPAWSELPNPESA